MCVCVCVCVIERERERERGRDPRTIGSSKLAFHTGLALCFFTSVLNVTCRKVDIRLPGKDISKSRGARPVYQ